MPIRTERLTIRVNFAQAVSRRSKLCIQTAPGAAGSTVGPAGGEQAGAAKLPIVTAIIRPAEMSDAPLITTLLSQLGYPASTGDVAVRLGYWREDSHSRLLVAEVYGHVSGVAAMHAIPLLEHTGRRARLGALVVGDAVRTQGVGRALVKAAEHAARDLNCRDMEITSARDRAVAQSFYAHLGYNDVSSRAARLMKLL